MAPKSSPERAASISRILSAYAHPFRIETSLLRKSVPAPPSVQPDVVKRAPRRGPIKLSADRVQFILDRRGISMLELLTEFRDHFGFTISANSVYRVWSGVIK